MNSIAKEDKDFFEHIDRLDRAIEQQRQNKINYLRPIVEHIQTNVQILENLLDTHKEKIINEIKEIGKSLGFEIRNYDNDLGVDKILREITDRFPIKTDGNESIATDLPRLTNDWIIESESTDDFIRWNINPIDNSVRYPIDPDNNPYWFDYIIPRKVHEDSKDEKQQELVLTQYLEEVVRLQLESVKYIIEHKKKSVDKTIDSIDFNNPLIVAEIKNKLGL